MATSAPDIQLSDWLNHSSERLPPRIRVYGDLCTEVESQLTQICIHQPNSAIPQMTRLRHPVPHEASISIFPHRPCYLSAFFSSVLATAFLGSQWFCLEGRQGSVLNQKGGYVV